jgi:hypothetical protein
MLKHILHHAIIWSNETKQVGLSSNISDLYLGVWFEYWPIILRIYTDFLSFPRKCLDNTLN